MYIYLASRLAHLHCLTSWLSLHNNNNILWVDLTSNGGNPFHEEEMRAFTRTTDSVMAGQIE